MKQFLIRPSQIDVRCVMPLRSGTSFYTLPWAFTNSQKRCRNDCSSSTAAVAPADALFPLQMYKFEHLTLPGPHNGDWYLRIMYGEDYMIPKGA